MVYSKQNQAVCSIVISTTDHHALSQDHLLAIRKNLDKFKVLESIDFSIQMYKHNVQKNTLAALVDRSDKDSKVNLYCTVNMEDAKELVNDSVDLGEAVYRHLYYQIREHLVLN